jgi:hypothetical protein
MTRQHPTSHHHHRMTSTYMKMMGLDQDPLYIPWCLIGTISNAIGIIDCMNCSSLIFKHQLLKDGELSWTILMRMRLRRYSLNACIASSKRFRPPPPNMEKKPTKPGKALPRKGGRSWTDNGQTHIKRR